MGRKIQEYFKLAPYDNHRIKDIINLSVLLYIFVDIIVSLVIIASDDSSDKKIKLLYRILIEIFGLIIIHIIAKKLRDSRYLDLIQFIKYSLIIIAWTETQDTSLVSVQEYITITIVFVELVQAKFVQTFIIIFSISYGLFRLGFLFETTIDILNIVRFVMLHFILQYLQYKLQNSTSNHQKRPSNISLIEMGQKSYTPIPVNKQQQKRSNQQIYFENINPNLLCQSQIESDRQNQQNFLYEDLLLKNSQCGIYIIESVQEITRIINNNLGHIILKNDIFSQEFINTWLIDFQTDQLQRQITISPKFNRSKDIQDFLSFIQTLNYEKQQIAKQEDDETSDFRMREIQLYSSNMQIKTLIDHFIAFLTLKDKVQHNKDLVDFSLKIYGKMDSFYFSMNLTPIYYNNRIQLALFIYDLTEEPFLKKISQNQKQVENQITDISSQIKHSLNCTISMIELALKSVTSQIADQFLYPALSSCKLLLSQANDIVDFIQVRRNGKLNHNYLDIQTRDFLSDIILMIKNQAVFKGLSVKLNVKSNVPLFIRTDPNRLRQIVLNLLIISMQATVTGEIILHCVKSVSLVDDIELIVKTNAEETKFSILKQVDKTVKQLNSMNLKQSPYPEFGDKQYIQSIMMSFYICLSLCQLPFTYQYKKYDSKEKFQFVINIRNMNPGFQMQLNSRRASSIGQQVGFKQVFNTTQDIKRHMSSRLSIPLQLNKNIEIQQPIQQQILEEDQISNSSGQSAEIENQLDKIIKPQLNFLESIHEKNDKNEKSGLYSQQQSRESITFGGRSSIYSSMQISSGNMQPSDLIDCFDRMDKMKSQKYQSTCDVIINYYKCPKIIISEEVDLDLFALSHQLENIGIQFEILPSREMIIDRVQVEQPLCCKGNLFFIGFESVDEELGKLCNKIKDLGVEQKREYRIIGLIGFLDEENRSLLKKMPFHDFLAKPIMIDALLFILAKWIKF